MKAAFPMEPRADPARICGFSSSSWQLTELEHPGWQLVLSQSCCFPKCFGASTRDLRMGRVKRDLKDHLGRESWDSWGPGS